MPNPGSAPRVSILLPVRNGGPTLVAALESVRRQTESSWELIAVNDGSSDETATLLADAARREARIRLLETSPHQRGLVPALNTGLEAARAPLVARLDADDICHPHRLARQADRLDDCPALGLVSCQVEFGPGGQAAGGYARHVDWLNSLTSPESIRRARFIESPLAHPAVMFRRDLVARHGGYRHGPFPEDYELWLRWLDAGVRMASVPAALLTWNDSPGRLSRTDPRYAVPAFFAIKAIYLAAWLRRELPPERPIWIWGAGRLTRRRVDPLLAAGCRPAAWIDIDPRKLGRVHAGAPVVAPSALREAAPRPFVLPFVGGWEARPIIQQSLDDAGFREEIDYLCCA